MPIFQLRPKDKFFELAGENVDLTWQVLGPLFMRNMGICEAIEYPPGYRGDIMQEKWRNVMPMTQFLLRVDSTGEAADFVDIDGRIANATLDPQSDASYLNAVRMGTSKPHNNFAALGATVDDRYFVAGALLCLPADEARATRNLFPMAMAEPQ